MIDIHAHILPSIDDGAATLEVAVDMCRLAAEDGCTAVVATPHQRTPTWWNCEASEIERGLEEVRAEVRPALDLHLGGEIRIDPGLLASLAARGNDGLLALAGSDYVLLEFNRRGFGTLDPEDLTHELRLTGWKPIFAHPEFIPGLADNLELMRRVVAKGGLFQVTAMSFTGGFGRRARKTVEAMIGAGLIHFIASDAHDLAHRPPGLRRAHDLLTRKYGDGLAHRLTTANPRAILDNDPINWCR